MTGFAIRPGQALPVGAPVRVRKHPLRHIAVRPFICAVSKVKSLM